MLCCYFR